MALEREAATGGALVFMVWNHSRLAALFLGCALAVAWAWKSRYAVPAVLAAAAVVGWGVMR